MSRTRRGPRLTGRRLACIRFARPLMVKEDYLPAPMNLDVWKEEMALIQEFAESCGVATPLFSTTAPLYEAAIASGRGNEDTAAVYEVLKGLDAPGKTEP